MVRTELKELIDECYRMLGPDETAHLADGIKSVGFDFATRGGMTIGVFDIEVPKDKGARLKAADEGVAQIDRQFARAYALSVYKSPSLADMREGAAGLSAILDVEMDLHVKLCAGWGLSPDDLKHAPPAAEA